MMFPPLLCTCVDRPLSGAATTVLHRTSNEGINKSIIVRFMMFLSFPFDAGRNSSPTIVS
jgi:hypothetical protein